jgi:hypothetical protein
MVEDTQIDDMLILFDVVKIPTDDQIRNFLDQIDPKYFINLFYPVINRLYLKNMRNDFKGLDDKYFILVLDASQYFSSTKIKCDNCIVKEHSNGDTEYTHSIIGASIVSPNLDIILPLPPENNVKDDTSKKQDCEQKGIYRWFSNNLDEVKKIFGDTNLIILADDLHSHDPLVDFLNENELKFILNCKENSHKTLYEFTKYNDLNNISYYDKVDGFKEQKLHTIYWLSNLPLRDLQESNNVNWMSIRIKNAKKTKIALPDEGKPSKKRKNLNMIILI